jgi:hypothetical protein
MLALVLGVDPCSAALKMPCFYTISLLRLLPSDNVLRSQQPRSQGLDPRSRLVYENYSSDKNMELK